MSFVALLLSLSERPALRVSSEQAGTVIDGQALQALRERCFAGAAGCSSLDEQREPPAFPVLSLLPDEGHQPHLRITLREEASRPVLPTLLEALTGASPLPFGTRWYHIQAIDLAHSVWAGLATWADFLAPPFGHTIRFHMGTPLVLLPETCPAPSQRLYHFPAPRPLFATLARRWQELSGPPLPVGYDDLLSLLEDGSVVLADYHLTAQAVRLDHAVRPGFRGWLCYACRTRQVSARATLAALARFAFFVGVGAFTEQGMGTTRTTIRKETM